VNFDGGGMEEGNVAFAKIPIWDKEYCGVQGAAPPANGIDPRFVYAKVLFELSCFQLQCSWLVSFLISNTYNSVRWSFTCQSVTSFLKMKCLYKTLSSTAALHTQYFKSQRYVVVYCLLPLLPCAITKKRAPIQHETASPLS
jgi:hypothetical protein